MVEGKALHNGLAVLRLIMDVRRTNSLFFQVEGDLHAISGGPSFLRAVRLPEEVMLMSAEDLVVVFFFW